MKKYIREMIDDLRRKKDYIPPVPAPATGGKTTYLDPPREPAMLDDLNNQILSKDPLERARQLDFQGQKDEERQSS